MFGGIPKIIVIDPIHNEFNYENENCTKISFYKIKLYNHSYFILWGLLDVSCLFVLKIKY